MSEGLRFSGCVGLSLACSSDASEFYKRVQGTLVADTKWQVSSKFGVDASLVMVSDIQIAVQIPAMCEELNGVKRSPDTEIPLDCEYFECSCWATWPGWEKDINGPRRRSLA